MSKRSVNLLRKIKGDFNVSAAGFRVQNLPSKTTTANTTLTAADSGKVIFCNGASAHQITLPAAATGLHFHFVSVNVTGDVDIVQAAAGEDFVGCITAHNGKQTADADDIQIVITAATGIVGDWVSLVCYNDDDWMVAGNAGASGGIAFAQS